MLLLFRSSPRVLLTSSAATVRVDGVRERVRLPVDTPGRIQRVQADRHGDDAVRDRQSVRGRGIDLDMEEDALWIAARQSTEGPRRVEDSNGAGAGSRR